MSAPHATAVRPGRRTLRSSLVGAAVVALAAVQVQHAPPAAAAEPVPTTYQGQSFPTAGPSPTGDKPQSKLWFTDGLWWALMRTSAGVTIHYLDVGTHAWVDTGTVVDERQASTGDALWEDGKLYIASRVSGGALRALRYGYDAGINTYTQEVEEQVASNGTESITIARDSQDRLWVTFTQGNQVYVAHTTTDDSTWSAPYVLPVPDPTISSDDLAAIIAFDGRIGVMWSDQVNDVIRFAVHRDGDPDTTWTMENALAGPNLADDHINLKSLLQDDQGRVFAVIKTSRGDAGEPSTDPSIVVLQRASNGTWVSATAARVSDGLTRPQIALDTTNDQMYVIMSTEGGGTVYYKRSPLGALSFPDGRGTPLVQWPGASINNATTTKQPVDATTGLVVLASDEDANRYYHSELSLSADADGVAPTVPQNLQGQPTSSTSVGLTWEAATDDVAVADYRVFRDGTQIGSTTSTSYSDTGLTAGTTYAYTVAAADAAGNVSAQSVPVQVTPAEPAAGAITFVGAATATGGGTSTTVPAPAGAATGDVLVAAVSSRGAPTVSAPPGWTQVRADANGFTMNQTLFVRSATTDNASMWTLSRAQDHVVQVAAYRGVDTSDPVIASAGGPANSTSIVSPSVDAVDGAQVVTVAGIARITKLGPTAPLTERVEVSTPSTARYAVTADLADTTARISPAGPYTTEAGGSAGGVGQTLSLRPGAGGGGGGGTEPDSAPPTVPTGVSGTPTSPTTANLTWQPATDDTGVTEYRIFRDGTQVGTTATTSYTDSGLTPETAYAYTVAAADAAGNASAQSSPATVTTPAADDGGTGGGTGGSAEFIGAATATGTTTTTAALGPAGVHAGDVLVANVSHRGSAVITPEPGWTLVRDDANGFTMRQAVYVKVATDADEPSTWTLSRTQTTVVQVLAYRGVDTTDPIVASAGQATSSATMVSPAVASVGGARVITLAGMARTTALEPEISERSEITADAAARYKLTANAADTTADRTSAGPFSTQAGGSTAGVAQTIALRPGAGGSGDGDGGGTEPDSTPPTVPTGVSGTPTSPTTANLTWQPATDDTGVTEYRVFRDGTQVGTTATTSYTDSGLTPETAYAYTVAAADAAGNASAQSSLATVTTPAADGGGGGGGGGTEPDSTPPTVPTGVSGTPTSPTTANLTWQPATDDTGVTEYRIFRDGTQVGTTATTSYTDSGLTPETAYAYTVAAADAAGNASAQSSPATVTTPAADDGGTGGGTGGSAEFIGAATATGTTTTTAALGPAGVHAGDVLVAAVSHRGSAVITPEPGWTLVRDDANGFTMRQAVYVKVATDADEPSTWTLSRTQTTVVQVLAYRGVDTTDPIVASAGQATSSATMVSPEAGSAPGGPVVTFAGIARAVGLAPEAPLTERSETVSPSGASYQLAANASDLTATGATAGPFTTTAAASGGGVAQTIALRAAP